MRRKKIIFDFLLLHALGIPGQIRHAQVNEARQRVATCAKTHGKLAGTTGSPELFNEYSKIGYDLINIGADVHAVKAYGENLLERMKTNIS